MAIRTWERENYTVKEVYYDYDLHKFVVVQFGLEQAIIPDNMAVMMDIIQELNAGAEVEGWADGNEGTIEIHDSLFERLRFLLEDKEISYEDFTNNYEDLNVKYENNGQSHFNLGAYWYTAINVENGKTFDFYVRG